MAKIGAYGYESRAPSLSFSIDTSQMAAFSERLKQWPAALANASVQAINATLKQGRRTAAQIIVEKYNIKQKDVTSEIKMNKAHRHQSSFSGSLTIHPSRRPGLGKFGSAQTAKGVTYQTLKGQGRRLIPGAYQYPKNKGKAYWVAIRPNPKNRKYVDYLQGISVWGMFASLSNQQKVKQRMTVEFKKNMEDMVQLQIKARTGQIEGAKFDKTGWMMRSGKRNK